MTPKINLKLSEVGCRKPGCARKLDRTARHHRRCETMFIRAFAKVSIKFPKPKSKSKTYKKLKSRYESFDTRDIIVLCDHHHCEIHLIYDEIILTSKIRLQKLGLAEYTWTQAYALMSDLRKTCYEWEVRETPGREPRDCLPDRRFPQAPKRTRKRRRR